MRRLYIPTGHSTEKIGYWLEGSAVFTTNYTMKDRKEFPIETINIVASTIYQRSDIIGPHKTH